MFTDRHLAEAWVLQVKDLGTEQFKEHCSAGLSPLHPKTRRFANSKNSVRSLIRLED